MTEHNRRVDDRRIAWERPTSILAIIISVLTISSMVFSASQKFASKSDVTTLKDDISRTYDSAISYIKTSQEAQDKFYQEWIENAVTNAALKASRETLRQYISMKKGKDIEDE